MFGRASPRFDALRCEWRRADKSDQLDITKGTVAEAEQIVRTGERPMICRVCHEWKLVPYHDTWRICPAKDRRITKDRRC